MLDKAFIYGLIGGAIGSYLTRPKQQPIQQQVQQQIAKMPHEFDYVVDVYTDRIEITDWNGSKTTLNSIDDLNNWLSGINGKDILIWNNRDMEGTLKLTSNRYVINGRPTRFQLLLTQPNTDLYHLAPNLSTEGITNETPRENAYAIDNSNIFAIDTTINIECLAERKMENVNITAINSKYLGICGINGRLSAITNYIEIQNSELINGLSLIADYAYLAEVGLAGEVYMFINYAYLLSLYKIDQKEITYANFDITSRSFLVLYGNDTKTTQIPSLPFINYAVTILGVYKADPGIATEAIYYPLNTNEGDIIVDKDNRTITVINKTNKAMYIIIPIRFISHI